MLFPLPSHLPKRNSVRQVDAALQTGALLIIAPYLRTIAGAPSRGFARLSSPPQRSSYRGSRSSLPRGRIMPAGVLLAPFRTGTTHVMELRLIGPRLFDQQRSADIRRNRPCLQSARGKAQRRIREHLIHRHSPIDGAVMIERDVLREISPSRHMFSRGKPRRRYRNLVKERMVDRLPRQGLRPRN